MSELVFDEVVEGLRRLDAAQVSLVADLVRVLSPVGAAVDAEVGDVVLAAFRLEAALEGSAAQWLHRFDTSLGWAEDGARSAAGWVSVRVAVSKRRGGGAVKRARDLSAMAMAGEAFAGGRIGPEQVRMLVEVRSLVPGVFAEREAYLVANVETLTVEATAVFLQAWLLEALPNGGDDAALKDRFDTHLKISATRGGTLVSGWLDRETAVTSTDRDRPAADRPPRSTVPRATTSPSATQKRPRTIPGGSAS